MTTEIKFILMPAHEFSKLLEDACERAIAKVLTEQNDELLSIRQLCERIPGMTYYLFKQLRKQQKIQSIRGHYSLKSVKAALQRS